MPKLRDILWVRQAAPVLEDEEQLIMEGLAGLVRGVVGARVGPLILTNKRLIWYEKSVARPLKPIYGEVRLAEVEAVDKGTWFDFVFGGKRLRLHLRTGRSLNICEARGRLDEWIAAINKAIVPPAAG